MPSLKMGSKDVSDAYLGATPVSAIYKGSTLLWSRSVTPSRIFTRSQLSSTTLSSPSRAVFISPAGNMFATDWSSRCVKIFDSTGTYVRSFTPLSGKIPYGINGDATYLYVTYWDSPKIYKYQYSGTDVPTLKSTWTTSHQYNDGTDVYNGYLYVACAYDHVIMKIDVSSGAVTEIATGMTYSLNDLAIDKVNSRIVTTQNGGENNGTKGHIIIYDMSGNLLVDKEMNGTYASKMDSPQGVVVDASGYIYLGGAYTSTGSYNQGFMVMDKDLNILHDLTQSECPTFCYTFNYDSYHNRVVWIGTSSPYIYGIDL